MTDQEKIHNTLTHLATPQGQALIKKLKQANIWTGIGFITLTTFFVLCYYLGMNLIESYLINNL